VLITEYLSRSSVVKSRGVLRMEAIIVYLAISLGSYSAWVTLDEWRRQRSPP